MRRFFQNQQHNFLQQQRTTKKNKCAKINFNLWKEKNFNKKKHGTSVPSSFFLFLFFFNISFIAEIAILISALSKKAPLQEMALSTISDTSTEKEIK